MIENTLPPATALLTPTASALNQKSNRSRRYRLLLAALFAFLVAIVCARWYYQASGGEVGARYTKYEFRIPMRDGIKLFTAIYVPKDTSHPYPFLVNRTPYGVTPYGSKHFPRQLGPSEAFDRAGYIFVFQDVRGRYQSEGEFVDARPHIDHPQPGQTDESTDMYDTVEWLLKHVTGNNGNVGIWGISYAGFYTSASIVNSHPAIKAASPEAPVTDLFRGDDAYHNGAFMLNAQFEFYSTYFKLRPDGPDFPPSDWTQFDYGTNDGYQYFLRHGPDLKDIAASIKSPLFDANIAHNTDDEYWQARDISKHMDGIHCAVLNVAGWFDAEDLAGPFRTYHAIEKNNPGILNVLVVGPWEHGAWARLRSDSPAQNEFQAEKYYRENIVFPFFEHFLKATAETHLPEATVFETGTNVWRSYDAWPARNAMQKTIYLRANGRLSFDPPKPGEAPFDEYVSDPAHPVPYIAHSPTELSSKYMFADQHFAAKRPDVLTYTSDPLTEDITVVGAVAPHLQVSTSGSDSDFVVKLIDVFPGRINSHTESEWERPPNDVPTANDSTSGYEQLVRGEPMRAKFRNSWSKPEPMKPNEVTPVNFEMPDVNHTFRRGHRIMVQIQSSWFPLTDMNPQTFMNIAEAKPSDFVKATERVYHTKDAASGIAVRVLASK